MGSLRLSILIRVDNLNQYYFRNYVGYMERIRQEPLHITHQETLLRRDRYTKCPTGLPRPHYSPLDSLPPPSRWFRDNMRAVRRDRPVARTIRVQAVSPFPETLVLGCEPPPADAPSPPPSQGTPAEAQSSSGGGGARGRGLNLMHLFPEHSTPPIGQGRGRGARLLALFQAYTPPVGSSSHQDTDNGPRPPHAYRGTPHSPEQYQATDYQGNSFPIRL